MNYDKKKHRVWDWKSPVILHWMINPGVMIPELIFGKTMPRVTLIEREGTKPFSQRTLVPCPHCGTLHSGLEWSSQNKTSSKNWFGYYCDNCRQIIPVQRNLTSLIILILTFPIWGWFKKSLRENWLIKQSERFSDINLEVSKEESWAKTWVRRGLLWALFMYAAATFIYPLIVQEPITEIGVLVGIPIWLIVGLGYGYTMKTLASRKGK